MTGQTLGRYSIVDIVGSGGMGVVYHAHDPSLARDVALKVLHPKVLENDGARQRFVSEAQTLSHLNHPNICTVYEIGEIDGRAFIAMEYVKGRTLSSLIPPDGLPLETMLRYGAQVADALAHAHQRGVVHRDLKSANVMVTPEGHAKVLDFGLAKRSEASPDSATVAQVVTQSGVVMGTPAYMAPEVLAGTPADARSDVWALGVILHEMAAGERPFAGNTAATLASAIIKEPPGALPPLIPPAVRGIIHRCLAKEPGQRYQSASEVRAALETAGAESVAVAVLPQRTSRRTLVWALGGVSAVGLVIVLAVYLGVWPGRHLPASRIQSIAVLPLENLSGDPEQEYFADGMTEQLTADLSRISGLRVISRTSVMQYKKARKPLPEIARELNVDAVLEGSVVRAGDKVRITAKLIRATLDEENLWAQSYERDLRDILALQGEVARRIASEINISLTPQEEARLASARPVDPEAHQLFLLGRFHANKATEEGLKKAIQYFDLAIAKDPGDASAYAGLAEAYTDFSSWYAPPREAMPKAKTAALTALRLDDSLAGAHAALGFIYLVYDWDGPAAERELQRAIQLNPSLAIARLNHAAYLLTAERREEAVQEVRLAVELDPLSVRTYSKGAIFLIFARRNDEAIELARKGQDLDPNFAFGPAFEGLAQSEQGRFQEAVSNLQKAARLDNNPSILGLGAHVHAVAGQKVEGRKLIQQAEEVAKHRYFCPYEVATAYVSLGDPDTALKWFRKGVEARADCMAWLGVEPWIEPFRSDPRYAQLLRDVGLAPRAAATPRR